MNTILQHTAPEQVAIKFSEVLKEWVGIKKLRAIVSRNEAENDSSICHSHDFCDANMAMVEAMEKMGLDYETNDELFNQAWNIAKENAFYTKKVKSKIMDEAITLIEGDLQELKADLTSAIKSGKKVRGLTVDDLRARIAEIEQLLK